LFSDDACTLEVGSEVAENQDVILESNFLSVGTYVFKAKAVSPHGHASKCSSVSVPYTLEACASGYKHSPDGSVFKSVDSFCEPIFELALDASMSQSYPGTGTTWFDLSGNDFHADFINSPVHQSAHGGNFLFDWTDNDSFLITHNGGLDFNSQDFSTEFWVKLNSATGDWQALLQSSVTTSATRQYGWAVNANMTLRLWLTLNGSWSTRLTSNTVFNTGEWYHIATVYRDTQNIELYVDGVHEKTSATTGNLSYSTTLLRIGSRYSTEWLDGHMAMIKIYRRPITAEEISSSFLSTKDKFGK
jgi:hypothetical protein